jgi:hypothetical protein
MPPPKKSSASKQLILEYFLDNLGEVLESRDIQRASGGAVEWARRVRELRNEEGYQILSHKDRANLRPGQYLLETKVCLPAFKRGISKETRAWVLERNGFTCQMCGLAAGDPDPFGGQRTVRLTLGHIKDKSKGGDDSAQNLSRRLHKLQRRIAEHCFTKTGPHPSACPGAPCYDWRSASSSGMAVTEIQE